MARARTRRRRKHANPRGVIRYRGRFVSATPRRRRRSRKNPGNPRGWFKRRGRRYGRRGTRIRVRGRRRFSRPSVRTYRRRMGIAANPPVRRRRGRRYLRRANNPVRRRRHGRRRYRSNPSGRVRRHASLMSSPFKAVMDVVKDAFSRPTLETMVHTGLGFGGALVISKFASGRNILNVTGEATTDKVARVATAFGGTILSSLLGSMALGPQAGARMVIGGLLATLWQGVTELVKGTAAADFVPTLGQAVDEDFRKAVETEVLRNLRRGSGMHAYLTPAGSERYLQPAGSAAYFTPRGAGMGAFATERSVINAGVGTSSEFGRPSEFETERF